MTSDTVEDSDTDLEECPFCRFMVDNPCDTPPPALCYKAGEIMLAEQAAKEKKL